MQAVELIRLVVGPTFEPHKTDRSLLQVAVPLPHSKHLLYPAHHICHRNERLSGRSRTEELYTHTVWRFTVVVAIQFCPIVQLHKVRHSVSCPISINSQSLYHSERSSEFKTKTMSSSLPCQAAH